MATSKYMRSLSFSLLFMMGLLLLLMQLFSLAEGRRLECHANCISSNNSSGSGYDLKSLIVRFLSGAAAATTIKAEGPPTSPGHSPGIGHGSPPNALG
ncbi:hypothetical protein IHE45_11G037700 [Dioscorea alata]|uniref:Uncharacterized protein n=1 Tax=Dioscorea alata TaxID=55571 RepID=A0ACB7V5X7_DIOAL|nr:hypothetical protein IHE45_11G037700 [Dioscorea alata]